MRYSIIIPHYNTPELLVRCLRSIPVRPDVQVIVVDDCSPGNEKYREQIPELSRPYLEYYTTPIGGSAGRARNIGLQHARGQWCLFADADDYYVDGFLDVIEQKLEAGTEILYFNIAGTSHRAQQHQEMYELYLKHNDDTQIRYHIWAPWNKVISRQLIEQHQLRFEEVRYGNDALFGLKVSKAACHYQIIPDQLYLLTDNEGSLSFSTHSFEREYSYTAVHIRINRFLAAEGLQYKYGYQLISVARIKRLIKQFGIKNCMRYLRLVSTEYGLLTAFGYYLKRKHFQRQHPNLLYCD